jgi:PilZ domain
MNTHVLYVNVTDTVTLACEACHRSKTLPAATVKDLPQPLTVRCPCGALFGVTVISRSCYRKHTQLPGTYTQRDAQTGQVHARGQMIVEDLSRTGLGFRPRGPHAVRVHDVLLVAFRLDDPQQSLIQKAVRVRRIADGRIGGEFLDHDTYTETNRLLGFYLRP